MSFTPCTQLKCVKLHFTAEVSGAAFSPAVKVLVNGVAANSVTFVSPSLLRIKLEGKAGDDAEVTVECNPDSVDAAEATPLSAADTVYSVTALVAAAALIVFAVVVSRRRRLRERLRSR